MKHVNWLGSLLLLGACGGSPTPTDAGGGGNDTGRPNDTGAPVDAPTAGPPLHNCEEADFVDRTTGADETRMIMVPTGETAFDPPCMTVRAGQSVMFAWDFSMHPLEPGVAPAHPGTSTSPTPIEAQATGTTYTATFPTAGDYGFYCATHFHLAMLGVVRVVP